ncbi:MAG: nitrate/nitrite transporter [Haloferacaceae archaeon]
MPPNPLRRVATAVSSPGRGLRGGGRGWTLLAVAAGWLLVLGLRFLVPALLPQIKAEFSLDNATAGLAVTVIWATYGLAQFPAGIMADRIGERRLLAGSLALGALSLVVLWGSPVFLAFLVGCTVYGVGTGLYGPARGMVLSRTFSDRQGAAFGLTLAAGSIGSAAFPFLSGLLVTSLGWRVTVLLALPFLLLTAVLLWRFVPEREAGSGRTMSRAQFRADLLPAVRDPAVLVAVAAVTLMLFTFQGLTAFLPTYLIEQKGLTQQTSSALFAGLFLAGAAFQILGGSVADRFGDRVVLAGFSALGVLTLAAVPLAAGLPALTVVVALIGSRMAIIPVSNAYIIRILPDAVQGTAWGLVRTAFFLVGATGSMFVGTLADAGLFDEAFYALAALTAAAAALFLYLPDHANA